MRYIRVFTEEYIKDWHRAHGTKPNKELLLMDLNMFTPEEVESLVKGRANEIFR